MTDKKPAPGRYKVTNWRQYSATLKARGSLTMWLDPGMHWLAQPNGKLGRDQTFSDAAIEFFLTIKCLYGLPLRQSMGMVQSLLALAGLDWPVPDFSTVSRCQKTLQVRLPYWPKKGELDLLGDSTGIKFLGEGEWKRCTHGAEYRRQWRKMHLAIDTQTLEIRAIEVTDNTTGDAPMLPELLTQISADEVIGNVSADGAYNARGCHDAIAQRGDSAAKECGDDVEGVQRRSLRAQPSGTGLPATGAQNLDSVERLSLARSGENQDALLQRLGERVVVDRRIVQQSRDMTNITPLQKFEFY